MLTIFNIIDFIFWIHDQWIIVVINCFGFHIINAIFWNENHYFLDSGSMDNASDNLFLDSTLSDNESSVFTLSSPEYSYYRQNSRILFKDPNNKNCRCNKLNRKYK